MMRGRAVIGLDVDASQVCAVRVEAGGARPRLTACATFERAEQGDAPTTSEAERAACILARRGVTTGVGDRIAAGVPDHLLLVSTLELPPRSSGAPIESLATAELARVHQCAAERMESRSWELPAPSRAAAATHLLGVGCEHAEAEGFLRPLAAAGLSVVRFEPRPVALARACDPLITGRDAIALIVEVGDAAASLVVMHKGVVVSARASTEAGLDRLRRSIAERLRVDADAARMLAGRAVSIAPPDVVRLITAHVAMVAEEAKASVAYAEYRYPGVQLSDVLVCGSGAALPGLVEQLALRVGGTPKIVNPMDIADVAPPLASSPESVGRNASLAVATGLALGVLEAAA